MQITKEFITAGNAHFTATNAGGRKFAYQITNQTRECQADSHGSLLVYCWSGADLFECSRGRRRYVGRLNPATGEVYISRRSRFTSDSMAYKVIQWVCNVLWTDRRFPVGYEVETNGRCGRCGHRLIDPTQYFGPECQIQAIRGRSPIDGVALFAEAMSRSYRRLV
jgi:hypothetical protein